MHDSNGLWIFLFMLFGGSLGASLAIGVAFAIGFLGDVRASWQTGRKIALLVTEEEHSRRVELLAKMIELERAMQQVPPEEPLIGSRDEIVNQSAACQ